MKKLTQKEYIQRLCKVAVGIYRNRYVVSSKGYDYLMGKVNKL